MKLTRGFTLVEMMFTVAIVAIVALAAAPSFNNLMTWIQMDGALSSVRSSLVFARSEAASQSAIVTICSSDTEVVPPVCTGDTDWRDGWIVFYDDNDNGVIDGAEELIRSFSALALGATLEETNNLTFQTFNPDGSIDVGTNIELTLVINNQCGAEQMPVLSVENVGRVDVDMQDCP